MNGFEIQKKKLKVQLKRKNSQIIDESNTMNSMTDAIIDGKIMVFNFKTISNNNTNK